MSGLSATIGSALGSISSWDWKTFGAIAGVASLAWNLASYFLGHGARVRVQIRQRDAADSTLVVDVRNRNYLNVVQVVRFDVLHPRGPFAWLHLCPRWPILCYRAQGDAYVQPTLAKEVKPWTTEVLSVDPKDVDGHNPDIYQENGGRARPMDRPIRVRIQLGTGQWKTSGKRDLKSHRWWQHLG